MIRQAINTLTVAVALLAASPALTTANDFHDDSGKNDNDGKSNSVQLGPRPFYLVDGHGQGLAEGQADAVQGGPFYRTDFSIGHRGAALQFPEHTRESYEAAARMGAGIVECDVTFTKDGDLVCRHAECDLHTTTNILAMDHLADKCEVKWTGPNQKPEPKCCTSALTLDEFKSLTGKMDAADPKATTLEGYLGGTPSWRTDLYTGRGTLMTFRESIELNPIVFGIAIAINFGI